MHRSIVTFHQVLSLGFSAGCLFVGLRAGHRKARRDVGWSGFQVSGGFQEVGSQVQL